MQHTSFSLFEKSHHASFLGTRYRAKQLRIELEVLLSRHPEITLDFTGFDATQSFIDELVGQLVLQRGADFLQHVTFKGCSAELKAIVEFVISDRLSQLEAARTSYLRPPSTKPKSARRSRERDLGP